MINRLFIAVALLAPLPVFAQRAGLDTVHVAAPTGEKEIDRANILAALEQVRPGGTVQFAPGTYMVGEFIRVTVPRITLLGHPEATTLRGCDPATFSDVEAAMVGCSGLALIGERQTVRDLTFEHTWQALWVGCCLDPPSSQEAPEPPHVGGHLVEGNTFRASINGFRVIGDSPEPVVIRDNDFVNVWHAGGVNGRTAHILDNRVSVPDPGEVPVNGFPGLAIFVTAFDTRGERGFTCAGNVVSGNRIEGHPEGIAIAVYRSGASCRENVIRDNTIRASRARLTRPAWGVIGITNEADSTLAGVPITLADLSTEMADFFGLPADPADGDLIHDNLVQGNRIVGGEGLGIEILRASRNRIVDNAIHGIRTRDPFPGNTMYVPPVWVEGNGSAIWISPGSDENEIVGNTFEDIAASAVVIEGDSNRVELADPGDVVRDLGAGNDVKAPVAPQQSATARQQSAVQARRVEVDGHAMRVATAGLESRRPGQPVVVFESGGLSDLEAWGEVVTPGRSVAFTDVTVIDVTDGTAQFDMTVVVTGDRIAAVGRSGSVPVPAGAEVIDAADRYLIPGLWDMHAHVFSDRDWWESFLPLFVANGVTGIREMRWGVSAEAVRALEAGEVVAPPRIVAAGNMIVGHLSGGPATQVARSPEEARALVDSLHAVGAPFLKIMSDLSRETYGAISKRARSLGIPFFGHVAMDVRAADASDAGQHSMEHLLGLVEGCSSEEEAIIAEYGVAAIFPEGEYDEARYVERIDRALATQDDDRCRALAARFVENDTWQVPTLATLRGIVSRYERTGRDDPRLRYLSTSQLRVLGWFAAADTTRPGRERARIRRAEFARQKEIVGMLAAARVPFLAGTDAPEPGAFPGFGLHDELGLLVEAGVTPLQALQSATLSPARFLGRTDDLGTVEAGKLADLVLLDANPLEDISNTRRILAVVVDGRLLDRPALDALLSAVAAAQKNAAPAGGQREHP